MLASQLLNSALMASGSNRFVFEPTHEGRVAKDTGNHNHDEQ